MSQLSATTARGVTQPRTAGGIGCRRIALSGVISGHLLGQHLFELARSAVHIASPGWHRSLGCTRSTSRTKSYVWSNAPAPASRSTTTSASRIDGWEGAPRAVRRVAPAVGRDLERGVGAASARLSDRAQADVVAVLRDDDPRDRSCRGARRCASRRRVDSRRTEPKPIPTARRRLRSRRRPPATGAEERRDGGIDDDGSREAP